MVNSEEIHHQLQIEGLTQEMKAKIAELKDWVVRTAIPELPYLELNCLFLVGTKV